MVINIEHCCVITDSCLWFVLQLYELGTEPERKEFLDDLFTFMQKRGEWQNLLDDFGLYLVLKIICPRLIYKDTE